MSLTPNFVTSGEVRTTYTFDWETLFQALSNKLTTGLVIGDNKALI